MPIRAIAFDLDGLMFNTEELYIDVGSEILRRRGKEFTQELLDKMMGRQSHVALQFMIEMHELKDTVEDLIAETDAIFPEILRTRLQPMRGLLDLLTRLEANNRPKCIATSSRRTFVTKVLDAFQLEPRFDFILAQEDIVNGKPDPEIYRTAAARHGVAPAEMLVLEDSQNGCRSAIAAGAVTVAIPGDHSRNHDFNGVHLIATSLADERIYRLLAM